MELNQLARRIAKKIAPATAKAAEDKKQRDQYGTVQATESGAFVLVDGSPEPVRAHFSVNCIDGDRVVVHIVNHSVVVMTNLTHPNMSTAEAVSYAKDNPGTTVIQGLTISDTTLQNVDLYGFYATDGTLENTYIKGSSIDGSTFRDGTITGSAIDTSTFRDGQISGSVIDTSTFRDGQISGSVIDASTFKDGQISGSVIDASTFKNGQISGSAIDSSTLTNIPYAGIKDADIEVARVADAQIADATIEQAQIKNLSADFAHVTDGVIDNAKINHGDVKDLNANYAHITKGVIDNAKIGYADVDNLSAHYAEITNGHINSALIDTAAIVDEQVFTVTGNKATISEINADKITVRNLNAKNLTVDTADGYVTIGDKKTPTKEFIDSLKDELQQEIDGAVETFTSSAVPLLTNYPASDWKISGATAEEQRKAYAKHVGDICYVQQQGSDYDGFCYRFAYDSAEQSFKWVLIKDSSVTKALSDITDLQTFESNTTSWIEETDEGLTTIRQNHTALSGRVDGVEATANAALPASTFETFEQTTFKTVVDEVDEQSTTIVQIGETVRYGGRNYANVRTYNDVTVSGITLECEPPAYHIHGTNTKTDANWSLKSNAWYGNGDEVFESGDVITLSTDVPLPKGLYIQLNLVNKNGAQYNAVNLTGDGEKTFITTTIPENHDPDATTNINGFFGVMKTCGTVDVTFRIKLERGPIATPWDYASEDVTTLTNTVNTVKQTADTNKASITSLTKTVSDNATATTNRFNSVEQTVSGINTTIGSMQTAISKKADGSTVTTLTNNLNKVSDTVSGHTQELSSVTTTLSNGGRNLLRNSGAMESIDGITTWNASGGIDDGIATLPGNENWVNVSNASGIRLASVNDRDLVFSADVRATDSGATYVPVLEIGGNPSPTSISRSSMYKVVSVKEISTDSAIAPTTEWQRYYVTFRPKPGFFTSKDAGTSQVEPDWTSDYLKIAFHNHSDDTYEVRHLQLEYGKIPTAWSSAPEDFTSLSADYATFKSTVNEFEATVGKTTSVRYRLLRNNNNDAWWAVYETVGKNENWSNYHYALGGATTATGFDATTLRVGDIIVVEGVSTDSKSQHSFNAKVTSVPTSANAAIPCQTVSAVNTTGLAGRVTTAETSIKSNAEAIKLRATKSEVYDSTQPNLAPFYSIPYNDSSYWVLSSSQIGTADADGWCTISQTNVSSALNLHIRPKRSEHVTPNGKYTMLFEYVTTSKSGTVNWMYKPNDAVAQIITNASGTVALFSEKATYIPMTAKANAVSATGNTALCAVVLQLAAGSTFVGKIRISLYEGEYSGAYKPYSGKQLYASQAELKVESDRIGMVVSNKDASSALSLTANAMTYIGNNVTIKDKDGSQTVISGGKLNTSLISVGSFKDIGNYATKTDGRNRLRNTGAPVKCAVNTTNYQTFPLYSTDGDATFANNRTLADLGFEANDSVTLSFDWSTAQNGSTAITYGTFWIEWYGRKADGSNENAYLAKLGDTITMSSSNKSGHYVKTVTLNATTVQSKRLVLRSDKSVLVITVSNLKLERGSEKTAYSMALEDITPMTEVTTASNFNDFTKTGRYYIHVSGNTNAPSGVGHGLLEVNFDVGTPYQIYQPDVVDYYFKRKYTSSAWTAWTKVDAVGAQNLANTANNKASAWYGTSGGNWDAAAKTGAVAGFTSDYLVTGTTIVLRSIGSNNVASALTLNVQNTGAKPIYVNGAAVSASNQLLWHTGAVLTFTYNGTGWEFSAPPNTVYATRISDAKATAEKVVYSTGTIIRKGTVLSTAFAASNTASAPTLNVAVNGSGDTKLGAKPIYYGTSSSNRPTEANGMSWIADTEVLLTFDGANWRMGGKTYIDGGHILANSISADRIKVSEIKIGNLSGYTDVSNRISKGESALTKTNYYNRHAHVGQSGSTTTNPWYKVASSSLTTQYVDYEIVFDVFNSGGFINGNIGSQSCGRLYVHYRAGSGVNSVESPYIKWENRGSDITLANFVLAYKLTAGSRIDAEIWAKCDHTYSGYHFQVVYDNDRSTVTETSPWTLYNTWSAGSASAITSGYTQVKSTDMSNAYITHIDDNGIRVHPSSTENDRVEIKAAGMQVYKGGNLKANYADTITLYGGNAAGGANPKITIGEKVDSVDSLAMYDSGGNRRILMNSSVGLLIGRSDKQHITINDSNVDIYNNASTPTLSARMNADGMSMYRAGSLRAQTTDSGFNVYAKDGKTVAASISSTSDSLFTNIKMFDAQLSAGKGGGSLSITANNDTSNESYISIQAIGKTNSAALQLTPFTSTEIQGLNIYPNRATMHSSNTAGFFASTADYEISFQIATSGNRGVYDNTEGRWLVFYSGSTGNIYLGPDSRDFDYQNESTTSGQIDLAAGKGASITWKLNVPSGYQFAGIYNVTTNHNQACSIGRFGYSSSNNEATVVVTNRSTTNFSKSNNTGVTASMGVHFIRPVIKV